MSAPLPLVVPQPSLAYTPIAGSYAPLEGTVAIAFQPVRFPDGSPMTVDDFVAAEALLMRLSGPMAGVDVWDAGSKSWRAAGTVDWGAVRGVPLLPPKSAFAPWEGVLVGAGQKDAAGAPLLLPAVGSFPQYRLRGSFHAKRDQQEAFGLGPDSVRLEFASAAEKTRFAARLTPDADSATRVQLMLRDGAAQPMGVLDIDASGGTPIVTLQNFTGSGGPIASITLQGDGAIRLTPAAGMRVIVAGDLETEQIRYLPSSGLPKKTLN